ncbi:MAG: c-type cytochrome [Chloroflexi bacterium]|nr:c-type cytochrome [Chloroflexota bacterium]
MSNSLRAERIALAWVFLALVVLPAALFGYQAWRTHPGDVRVVEITARAPFAGGWQPDTIRVNRGERVRLQIAAIDAVHGMAIPALNIAVDEILPGHVAQLEFVANQPGRFAFACTRWCSADHWRMRGVIEVVDPLQAAAPPAWTPPRYQQLGIDLDAIRPALNLPPAPPSPAHGATLAASFALPAIGSTDAPADMFARLRAEPAAAALTDAQVWDIVAYAWGRTTDASLLDLGRTLYARDCAACHGETGRGDGPAGRNLPGLAAMNSVLLRGPRNFTDRALMLSASDLLLEGKVIRGGMGTGMPEWRSLYSDDDVRAVVGFVRRFGWDTP